MNKEMQYRSRAQSRTWWFTLPLTLAYESWSLNDFVPMRFSHALWHLIKHSWHRLSGSYCTWPETERQSENMLFSERGGFEWNGLWSLWDQPLLDAASTMDGSDTILWPNEVANHLRRGIEMPWAFFLFLSKTIFWVEQNVFFYKHFSLW